MKIAVKNSHKRAEVVAKILRHPIPFDVEILPHKTPKTESQNNQMWVNNEKIAKYLNDVLLEHYERLLEYARNESYYESQREEVQLKLRLFNSAMQNPWTKESVHKNITKPQFIDGESSTKQGFEDMKDVLGKQEAWMAEIGMFE